MYGVHYDLGDRVTFRRNGEDFHKRIIADVIEMSNSGEKIRLEYADVV